MNLYKPGTKVRILKWDGSTGTYGDPTGRVGYISGDGRSVWSKKGGKGEYYCLAETRKGRCSKVEVIKEESVANKVTRDNLKKDTPYKVVDDGGMFALGTVVYLVHDDGTDMPYFNKDKDKGKFSDDTYPVLLERLEPAHKEVYEKDGNLYAREVVERLTIDGEEYVVTRDTDDGKVLITKLTYLELWGWKLKSEQEETVVSIEEIARKFGVDTDKLRIKE